MPASTVQESFEAFVNVLFRQQPLTQHVAEKGIEVHVVVGGQFFLKGVKYSRNVGVIKMLTARLFIRTVFAILASHSLFSLRAPWAIFLTCFSEDQRSDASSPSSPSTRARTLFIRFFDAACPAS